LTFLLEGWRGGWARAIVKGGGGIEKRRDIGDGRGDLVK